MLGSKVDWPKSAQVLFDDSSSMEDDRLSFGQNDYLPGTSVTQATHALPEGLTLFHPSIHLDQGRANTVGSSCTNSFT